VAGPCHHAVTHHLTHIKCCLDHVTSSQHLPQLEDHSSNGDDSYIYRGLQLQSPRQEDANRRAFESPAYQAPKDTMHGWQNSTVSSDPMSANVYVSTSSQPLLPPYIPY
jgi:hypothetical protein